MYFINFSEDDLDTMIRPKKAFSELAFIVCGVIF